MAIDAIHPQTLHHSLTRTLRHTECRATKLTPRHTSAQVARPIFAGAEPDLNLLRYRQIGTAGERRGGREWPTDLGTVRHRPCGESDWASPERAASRTVSDLDPRTLDAALWRLVWVVVLRRGVDSGGHPRVSGRPSKRSAALRFSSLNELQPSSRITVAADVIDSTVQPLRDRRARPRSPRGGYPSLPTFT